MEWFFLALFAALSDSLRDLFSKKGLQSAPFHIAALAASVFSLPILLSFFFVTSEIPHIGSQYWEALLWGGGLNVLAFVQFMRALEDSDLSLAIPFITFTPIFLLFTSPWLVGEFPGFVGLLGILLIVVGSYFLAIQGSDINLTDPFVAIVKEPGPRRMLSVAAIYSLTSNFDKIGVQSSSPLFWSLSINMVYGCGFVTYIFFRSHDQKLKRTHILISLCFYSSDSLALRR